MLVLLCLAQGARSQDRVALVIGNSVYVHVPALSNPANDALDVSRALERLGFSVQRVLDADRTAMLAALREFEQRAAQVNIAVVFYAGHGIEVDGANYLVPVDARLARDAHVEDEAIGLSRVLRSVEAAKKLRLILLDACRDDPFRAKMARSSPTRSISRGLARIEPPGSTLVAFAAKEQTVAQEGTGRNSPFTQSLLRYIETPGLEINFLFRAVRDDVMDLTNRRQEPFIYGSLTREPIYLNEGPAAIPAPSVSADEIAWTFLDRASATQLQKFIERFPNSKWRAEAERLKRSLEREARPQPRTAKPAETRAGKCFSFAGQRFCQ